jgi:hypothetical protein
MPTDLTLDQMKEFALVVARREIHNRAQGPCDGDPVLHARSGRLPH